MTEQFSSAPSRTTRPATLPRAVEAAHYPATAGQRRLWLFQKMYPTSTAYHMQGSIKVEAGMQLDNDRVHRIVSILAERHAALRTVFDLVDGGPVLVIRPALDPELVLIEADDPAAADKAIGQFSTKPFDLRRGPLFRVLSIRSPDETVRRLVWIFHHIVCDGVSLATLSSEFTTLLRSAAPTQGDLVPAPTTEFVDYACWQALGVDHEEARQYWLSLLKDRPLRLQLPYDYPASGAIESECASYTADVPLVVGVQLKRLAVSSGSTPFIILLSAFTLLLAKLSGERDFLLGVPASGRSRPGMKGVVGFFVNTVLIRAEVQPDQPFAQYIRSMRAQVVSALKYQDYPFDRLVAELGERTEVGRFPMVPLFFNMLTLNEAEAQLAPPVPGHRILQNEAKLDWDCYLLKRGDHIHVDCHYKRDLFHPETIAYLMDEYVQLLAALLSDPDRSLASLSLLTRRVAYDGRAAPLHARSVLPFNAKGAETPIECFENVVAACPQRLAVQDGRVAWTYKELDIQRRGIAQVLHTGGVRAGARVALLLDHDSAAVAAVLAVLSVGATYVPLDPWHPQERLRFLLEDSEAEALLVGSNHLDFPARMLDGRSQALVTVSCPDATTAAALAGDFKARIAPGPDQPAYILYTSGSTGAPKGVVQSNRNVLHHIRCYADALRIAPEDRLLAASCTFDAAVMDMFGALLTGAGLCVMDAEKLSTQEILRRINSEAVTIFRSTPTLLRHLFSGGVQDAYLMEHVRLVVLGGEATGAHEIALWKSRIPWDAVLVNGLGPTESPFALQHQLANSDERIPYPVPVGYAVDGTLIDLVANDRIQDHSFAVGEIVIRSEHVAIGYWRRPEETARAFGTDTEGRRFFRTGDYGQRWIDGSIRPLGRRDRQVKIQGVRVELGEVEAVLLRHPGIRDCVCFLNNEEGVEPVLIAYCVWTEGAHPDVAALRRHVLDHLPGAYCPSRWHDVTSIPRTPSGKIDRQALEGVTKMEIHGLLSELASLGIRFEVNEEDKLKCHAPKGVLSNDLRQRIQSHRDELAALLIRNRDAHTARPPLLRHAPGDRVPLSFSQERIWFAEQYSAGSTFYNMPVALRLTGPLDTPRLKDTLAVLLQRHEALRAIVREDEAGPAIEIRAELGLNLREEDWTAISEVQRAARLPARIREEAALVFDLRHGPLLRTTLLKLGEKDHVLLLAMHHIVSDGWSVGVLLRDAARLYEDGPEGLPALDFSYADYASWQRQPDTVRFLEGQLDHWKSVLLPHPPALDLPFDRQAGVPASARMEGAREKTVLPDALLAKAEKFARSHDVTLFALLLSSLKILLYRWTQQTDLTVGTVSAGRNHHALENVVGCFINSLAIRTRLAPGEQVVELIREVSAGLSQAYQHQDCPFEKVIGAVNPPRKAGANPLFNVAFLLQNFPVPERFAEGVEAEVLPVYSGGLNLDLRFVADKRDEEFAFCCEYDRARFKPETIQLLLAAFEGIVSLMIEQPTRPVDSIHASEIPALARLGVAPALQRHLAVASTFTAEPIRDVLEFWMEDLHGTARVSFVPYAQVFQSLLDPRSELARNRDTNILLLHLVDWTGEGIEAAQQKLEAARKACTDFIGTFSAFHQRSKATNIVVITPEVWSDAMPGAGELVADLRRELQQALALLPGAYLLDGADALRAYPVQQVADADANRIGHVPYTQEYFTALGTFLSRKIASLGRQPYKVIAVDCDNTLWGGVCAEVGPQAVEVSGGFRFLQEFLVEQHSQGMLICLCSKNQEGDVRAVFERHPGMMLTLDHIAATRVNWEPKSRNLQSLAKELNLSIDSFIFLDDNPIECTEVETACPSVLTLNMPDHPDEFEEFLMNTWEFDRLTVTREAAQRTDYYRQNRERQSLEQSSLSFEEFLEKLDLSVEIHPVAPQDLERAAELTQRTNQFNLSTLRRSARELDALLRSSALQGVTVKVTDRFGDYGLTGLMLYAAKADTLVVDTLLLSCRVLGRRVEHHLAQYLSEAARQHGCSHVVFAYRPTDRNQPILDFLAEQFSAWSREDAGSRIFEVPAARCSLVHPRPAKLEAIDRPALTQ